MIQLIRKILSYSEQLRDRSFTFLIAFLITTVAFMVSTEHSDSDTFEVGRFIYTLLVLEIFLTIPLFFYAQFSKKLEPETYTEESLGEKLKIFYFIQLLWIVLIPIVISVAYYTLIFIGYLLSLY